MTDLLLDLSTNPRTRGLIKGLGLPLPMPEKLRRARGPWQERPLADRTFAVGGLGRGALGPVLAATLARAGAESLVIGDEVEAAPLRAAGEAWGRPTRVHAPGAELPERLRLHGLVFDASGLETPASLRALYDFFHPLVGALERCGRVVVLGRPPDTRPDAAGAAASAALEGFVRSLAKEVGGKGSTAQLLRVDEGAEDRAPPVLRFLLSARSAFVTAQPLRVTTSVAGLGGAYPTTRPLEGRVALVTGAARGIGEATARLMAGEGAHVVVLDRPADDGPASRVARDIGGTLLLADVSDPGAPDAIASALREGPGGVDVVVHNAGVTRDKTLRRMDEARWDQTLDINLAALVRITAALTDGARPLLRDHGRVVCLSSVAGIAGNMGQTNYAASKAGVIGLVRALATELAPRGVAVNAVAPGFIETRMTHAMPVMIREAARRLSALGQGGQPQDVAEVITFLSTPGAEGITGSVVRVCGGALVGA